MLTISDLTFRMQGRLLLDNTSLTVPAGARVGFVGRNGTGKTTLFKLITGEYGPESGSVAVRRNMRIGQVAQEAPGTDVSLLETVLIADTERTALMAEAVKGEDSPEYRAAREHRLPAAAGTFVLARGLPGS